MTSPETLWDKSDRLLGGGAIAIRSVAMPTDEGPHAAVAVTLRVPGGQFQVDDQGVVTATVLLGPGEALGIGAWLREAAVAANPAGPPLYDWAPDA